MNIMRFMSIINLKWSMTRSEIPRNIKTGLRFLLNMNFWAVSTLKRIKYSRAQNTFLFCGALKRSWSQLAIHLRKKNVEKLMARLLSNASPAGLAKTDQGLFLTSHFFTGRFSCHVSDVILAKLMFNQVSFCFSRTTLNLLFLMTNPFKLIKRRPFFPTNVKHTHTLGICRDFF